MFANLVFSPDNQTLFSSCLNENVICQWNVESASVARVLEGHTSGVWSLALSSDGTILYSGDDIGTIIQWDSQCGKALDVFHGHTVPPFVFVFCAIFVLQFRGDDGILGAAGLVAGVAAGTCLGHFGMDFGVRQRRLALCLLHYFAAGLPQGGSHRGLPLGPRLGAFALLHGCHCADG